MRVWAYLPAHTSRRHDIRLVECNVLPRLSGRGEEEFSVRFPRSGEGFEIPHEHDVFLPVTCTYQPRRSKTGITVCRRWCWH